MKDEALEVQKWVETALRDATDELQRGCGTEKVLSDFKRGELCGVLIGLKSAKARMSWIPKQQEPYDTLNTWIREITLHSPLTIAAVIEIYDFCDMHNLLQVHDLVGTVIRLNAMGFTKDEIKDAIQKEAIIQSIFKKYENMRNEDE